MTPAFGDTDDPKQGISDDLTRDGEARAEDARCAELERERDKYRDMYRAENQNWHALYVERDRMEKALREIRAQYSDTPNVVRLVDAALSEGTKE